MNEVRLLLYLNQPHHAANRRELADFAGMPYRILVGTLQLLSVKGLVKLSEHREEDGGRKLSVQFTAQAQPALQGIATAIQDFDAARFEGFTEEERIWYARLREKEKENIVRILR